MNIANPESEPAAEGSTAHWIAERCMREEVAPHTFLDQWFYYLGKGEISEDPVDSIDPMYAFVCDEEMVAALSGYIAHCLRRPGKRFVEVRVDITPWCPIPDQFGTSDHVAIDIPGETLYVDDLKYGKGVLVKPQENIQAILYALGVINWLRKENPAALAKIKRVVIGIYQPRIDNIDEWETTIEEIPKHGEYIKERFSLAWSDNPPFGPDPKACQYCRVPACKPRADYMLEAIPDLDAAPEDVFLSDDEAAELWLKKPAYEAWFNSLHAYLFKRVSDGNPNSVLRMGEGRGSRYWKIPEWKVQAVLEGFGIDQTTTEPKIISPAQAEKKLRKKQKDFIQEFIGKRPGSPRLVPVGSKHRDYGDTMLEAIDDLDDELGL